jgi:hypothetical protein
LTFSSVVGFECVKLQNIKENLREVVKSVPERSLDGRRVFARLPRASRAADDAWSNAVGTACDFFHVEELLLLVNTLSSDADAAQSSVDAEAFVGS